MKVLTSSPVPVSRVRELLGKREKDGEELGYEQANALEHSREFSDADSKDVVALAEKLKKEVPSLDDETAIRIAEIAPKDAPLLKTIVAYSRIELAEEDINKILERINKAEG